METKAALGGAVAVRKAFRITSSALVQRPTHPRRALFVAALACAVLSACGDEDTIVGVLSEMPPPATPEQLADAQLSVVSGDEQDGEVDTVLPDSLVVQVTTSSGMPLGGAPVEWQFDAGHPPLEGGATVIDPRLVTITDRNGYSAVRWQLGTSAGDQSVSVRVMVPETVGQLGEGPSLASSFLRRFWGRARPGSPSTLTVTPTTASVTQGDSIQLTAQVRDRYGNLLEGRTITWSSSAQSVATTSQTGRVRAIGAGSATIRATTESVSGTSAIAVTSRVDLVPQVLVVRDQNSLAVQSLSLEAGSSVTLSVVAQTLAGVSLGIIAPTWSSTNPGVATVSSQGVVQALASGSANVIASYQGVTKTIPTTVTPPALPPPPPVPGGFAANAPRGLSTVADCDFVQAWSGGSGTLSCGLRVTDWNRSSYPNDQCRTIADPTSIFGGRVWESHYDNGAGGSGPCLLEASLSSARDTVYVSMRVKYQAGWQANTNDQKIIYIDTDRGAGDGMFAYRYGTEAIHYVTSATGCEALEANVALVPVKNPRESAPCQNQRAAVLTPGVWDEFEFLWICSTGTIKWWKNGELRGSHTNRSIGCVSNLRFPDTWGGGGTLTQEQSRYYDRIVVRASAN